MKKVLILFLLLTSILSIGTAANAHGPGPGERMEARRVLDETREYLQRAERVARRYQREDLSRAYNLQADAREFYRQWRYHRAIQQSLRAREIARDIIEEAERREPPRRHHRHHGDDDEGKSSVHINLKL